MRNVILWTLAALLAYTSTSIASSREDDSKATKRQEVEYFTPETLGPSPLGWLDSSAEVLRDAEMDVEMPASSGDANELADKLGWPELANLSHGRHLQWLKTLEPRSVERPEQLAGFIGNILQSPSRLSKDQRLILDAAFQALFRQVSGKEAYALFSHRSKVGAERFEDGFKFLMDKFAEHSLWGYMSALLKLIDGERISSFVEHMKDVEAKSNFFRNVFGLCTDCESMQWMLKFLWRHFTPQSLLQEFSSVLLSKEAVECGEAAYPKRHVVCNMIANEFLDYLSTRQDLDTFAYLHLKIEILYNDKFVTLLNMSYFHTGNFDFDHSAVRDYLIVSIHAKKMTVAQELAKKLASSLCISTAMLTNELLFALEGHHDLGKIIIENLSKPDCLLLKEQTEAVGCYGLSFIASGADPLDFDAISAFAVNSLGVIEYLIQNFDEIGRTMTLLKKMESVLVTEFAAIVQLVLSTKVESASFEGWIAALEECLRSPPSGWFHTCAQRGEAAPRVKVPAAAFMRAFENPNISSQFQSLFDNLDKDMEIHSALTSETLLERIHTTEFMEFYDKCTLDQHRWLHRSSERMGSDVHMLFKGATSTEELEFLERVTNLEGIVWAQHQSTSCHWNEYHCVRLVLDAKFAWSCAEFCRSFSGWKNIYHQLYREQIEKEILRKIPDVQLNENDFVAFAQAFAGLSITLSICDLPAIRGLSCEKMQSAEYLAKSVALTLHFQFDWRALFEEAWEHASYVDGTHIISLMPGSDVTMMLQHIGFFSQDVRRIDFHNVEGFIFGCFSSFNKA